ncbi:TetR/AcrR family transcriptional regulator [Levilactobacillus koreensis]|uniref:Transcriptional regulator n=1 Tax=Levilactobacillus koreensis TaxID=637971 RepID=A0AAC8UXK2_9LACO|nr:TetR/AcrR family transcriptional regulator [Levilactobacillus koreensis]AKP65753.1 transcriptional regulator [Levilactobacillus koreensis]
MTDEEKLQRIYAAASELFIQPGYHETQMQMIAQRAHVAVGTLYRLFSGKEALLDYVFLTTLPTTEGTSWSTYPLQPVDPRELVRRTEAAYADWNHQLAGQQTTSFDQLLTALFTAFKRYGRYFLILEHNPSVNPALTALYRQQRQEIYQHVGDFLQQHQPELNDPQRNGVIVVDLVFWWCAHKRYDSFETEMARNDDEQMLIVVREMLRRSYQ